MSGRKQCSYGAEFGVIRQRRHLVALSVSHSAGWLGDTGGKWGTGHYAANMSSGQPSPVTRVQAELAGLGAAGAPVAMRPEEIPTHSQILASTQVFEADGRPVLVVVNGSRRADPVNLAGVLGATTVRPVPDPVATLWTGQDPDAIAPVGHNEQIAVIIDVDLAQYRRIWAPAGAAGYLFPTTYAELLRITAGTAAEVGELPEPGPAPTMPV